MSDAMHGEDHGVLDYWAMFFGVVCFLGVWMWLGDWSLVARLIVMGVGVVGLGVTVWLIRRE